jgi:hypothetical protein
MSIYRNEFSSDVFGCFWFCLLKACAVDTLILSVHASVHQHVSGMSFFFFLREEEIEL